MANRIIGWIIGLLGAQTGKIAGVVFVAALPVIELRGAIPVAFALGLDLKTALICALIGNILPVPFILLFLEAVFGFMKKYRIFPGIVQRLEKTAVKKAQAKKLAAYEFWALCMFVAIPLPGTGAWTGALIASIFKMDKLKAFVSILTGVLISAAIVSLGTYGLIASIL